MVADGTGHCIQNYNCGTMKPICNANISTSIITLGGFIYLPKCSADKPVLSIGVMLYLAKDSRFWRIFHP